MAKPLLVTFAGGARGRWRVVRAEAVAGAPLAPVTHVDVREDGDAASSEPETWRLRGVASHRRYVTRSEEDALVRVQASLGRVEATRAALIPITKSDSWWSMTQDERREVFEGRSRHVAGTMRFLPAIARRLHHGRDLGEPFDFLTWFEYAPEHAALFDELVAMLRETEEWRYVEREIDIRLERA